MTFSSKRRPTVAFFVNDLQEDYTVALCRGITDAAEDNDVNLIVLSGETINMDYTGRYNYNVIYEFVSENNVDALVIASSVLCRCISNEEFREFCIRYKPIPIVSIGVQIEGFPSVLINGRTGLKDIVSHLVREHNREKIAFLKGPEGHEEAEERFSAYKEALEENGIDYNPELVVPGDFSVYSVENAIKILLDERKVSFDAIMAANDVMAFGVLDSLRRRKILVPEEVSVTGFDNGEGAKYSNPSLTTVKQPICEYTKKALETALEFIKGNNPANVILDTEMVIRESCGCLSESMQSFNSGKSGLQIDLPTEEDLTVEQLTSQFIAQNLRAIDSAEAKLAFLKPFVVKCFRLFSSKEFNEEKVEKLLRDLESVIDISELNGNDILIIQKTFSDLKNWLEALSKCNINYIADFIQRLRLLITDILIKMHGNQLKTHHIDIRHLRGLLVEMVSKINDYREQLRTVIPRMRAMGINNCFVYLYDKPVFYRKGDAWKNPSMVNLVMAYNDENWELSSSGCQLSWEKVLKNDWLPQGKRYTMMLYPLFVEDEHMGLIMLEFNMPNNYMFESLIVEMSCALKLALLFYEREQIDNRLQEVVKELEEHNQKLSNISQTDELTGLYNRRGFINLARQSLNLARKREKSGLLFFADMDGLKKINDQFGHDEGDIAIKAMGNILVKTFRASDIIARLGCDEFTVFTVESDFDLMPTIHKRLDKYIDEYNISSDKPYKLSITIGAVAFSYKEDLTLEELISRADELLYERKKQKKTMIRTLLDSDSKNEIH